MPSPLECPDSTSSPIPWHVTVFCRAMISSVQIFPLQHNSNLGFMTSKLPVDFGLGSSWKGASQGSASGRDLSPAPFLCYLCSPVNCAFLPAQWHSFSDDSHCSFACSLVARRWQLWVQVPSSPQPAETLQLNFSASSPRTATTSQKSGLPLLGRVLRNTWAGVHHGAPSSPAASSSQALPSGLCQELSASVLQETSSQGFSALTRGALEDT